MAPLQNKFFISLIVALVVRLSNLLIIFWNKAGKGKDCVPFAMSFNICFPNSLRLSGSIFKYSEEIRWAIVTNQ